MQLRPLFTGASGSPWVATTRPSLVPTSTPQPVPQKRHTPLSHLTPASPPAAASASFTPGTVTPAATAVAATALVLINSRRVNFISSLLTKKSISQNRSSSHLCDNLADRHGRNRTRPKTRPTAGTGSRSNFRSGNRADRNSEANSANRAGITAGATHDLLQSQAGWRDDGLQWPRRIISPLVYSSAFALLCAVAAERALAFGKIYMGEAAPTRFQDFLGANANAVAAPAAGPHKTQLVHRPGWTDDLSSPTETPTDKLRAANSVCHRAHPHFPIMGIRLRGNGSPSLDIDQIFQISRDVFILNFTSAQTTLNCIPLSKSVVFSVAYPTVKPTDSREETI